MKNIVRCVFLAATSLLSAVVLSASLTGKQIENYLNSFNEAVALGDKYPTPELRIDTRRPLGSALELMSKEANSYMELSALAKKYQFDSAEQWADVGDRVMQGYLVLESGQSLQSMKANYDGAVGRIMNDASLSDQHKQGVLKGMEKGYLRNVKMVKDAEADLAVLKPYMPQIAPYFTD